MSKIRNNMLSFPVKQGSDFRELHFQILFLTVKYSIYSLSLD